MTLKNILAVAALAVAGSAVAATPSLRDLEAYCYPNNRAASVTTPQWLPDDAGYALLNDAGTAIQIFDPQTGKAVDTLLDLNAARGDTRLPSIEGFTLSPDGKKVLVWTGEEHVYRRSTTARHYIYDTHSRILKPLSTDCEVQRMPVFSPDSRMVAFVDQLNNIRIAKLDYSTEVAVTTDGAKGQVINGVPDWTYEEEFFTTCSMAWAPDNLTLCYLKYNERQVNLYDMALYRSPCEDDNEGDNDLICYPGSYKYKYPCAGTPNSTVTLHSYDIETRKTKTIDLPGEPEYVVKIAYAPGDASRLVVAALNRDQTVMDVLLANPRSTTVTRAWSLKTQDGWVEPICYTALTPLDNSFVTASDASGWTRLIEVGYNGTVTQQITPADQDATDYYGYDKSTGRHWWQSTGGDPLNRVVGNTDAKGLTKTVGRTDGTMSATFSDGMRYAVTNFNDPVTPPLYTIVATKDFKQLRVLEDNAELTAKFASMPRPEFVVIPADGTTPALNAYVIRPVGNTPSGKAPVIMYQYSGPGSQEVRRRWQVDWMHYFAQQGYMVVCADGRGTGGRGRDFRTAVYRDLGNLETVDQLRVARWVSTLAGADASRIGIYGWSYGGYETLMCVTDPQCPFRAACAIAPVTDWRAYDTAYTERYMLTPQQNDEGYLRSAPINRAQHLNDNCSLLLIHGTSDDNVHITNTYDFLSEVMGIGKNPPDLLVFPAMNHSINGCQMRAMTYWRMLRHFNANL